MTAEPYKVSGRFKATAERGWKGAKGCQDSILHWRLRIGERRRYEWKHCKDWSQFNVQLRGDD